MRSSTKFLRFPRLSLAVVFVSAAAFAMEISEHSPISDLQIALRGNAASAAQAAAALAKLGSVAKPVLADLVDALRFDEDIVTAPVGDALLAIGPAAISPLVVCLKDPNFFVRQRASIILGRFGARAKPASRGLAELTLDPTYQVNRAASQSLLQIGPDALPALVAVYSDEDEKGQITLLDVIGGLGPSAAPFLLRTLSKSESVFVRVKAAEMLGSTRPTSPEIIAGLVDTLNNMDERVRLSAVNGLAALGEQAKVAIGPLIVASQTDSDPLVRQKALDALAGIGAATAASLPGLARALHSPQTEVRSAVVAAVATCPEDPTHTLSILQAAARDSDPTVQSKAQEAMAHPPSRASSANAAAAASATPVHP